MIADFLLGLVVSLLGPLVSALPEWHLPVVGAFAQIGATVYGLDDIVPVAGPLRLMVTLLALMPAFIAFRIGLWVYGLIRGGGGDT